MFGFFKKKYSFLPVFSWKDFFVLSGGLVVFVGLAASSISKFSIWFDEAFGAYLIRFDLGAIARYTSTDVHPPLYYWLLKLWSLAFGNTELGIRSMSVFFGAVTIVFAFLLVLRLFGRKAAYMSLLFLVLSPMFIRYGQEARMYTLLTAIIVAATYVLVYASQTKKRWPWVTYGVLVAAGMLTQYFAALAWAAHWVWRLLVVRSANESVEITLKKLFSREWVLAYAVAIGLFLAWLPFLVVQFLTVQGYGFWIKPVTSNTLADFLTNVFIFSNGAGVQSWLAIGFYVLVTAMIYMTYRLLRTLKGDQHQNYLLIVCMVIVPIILLFLMSLPPLRSAFVDRYLMGSAVFIAILMGINLAYARVLLGIRVAVVVGLTAIVLFAVGIANQMAIGNYNKSSGQSNNVRQLIEKVREVSTPDTPILANTPWIFYEAAIYETPQSPVYFVNEITKYRYGSLTMLKENDMHKITNLDAFIGQHKTVWLIGNLRDKEPRALRGNWQSDRSITINDDITGKPLFKAVRFNAE